MKKIHFNKFLTLLFTGLFIVGLTVIFEPQKPVSAATEITLKAGEEKEISYSSDYDFDLTVTSTNEGVAKGFQSSKGMASSSFFGSSVTKYTANVKITAIAAGKATISIYNGRTLVEQFSVTVTSNIKKVSKKTQSITIKWNRDGIDEC